MVGNQYYNAYLSVLIILKYILTILEKSLYLISFFNIDLIVFLQNVNIKSE